MTRLYSSALFLSAFLLFAIQPMAAKRLLPWFGGSPDVWNTCMFFFQGTLLAGYLYAHVLSRRLKLGSQLWVHAVVLALALCLVGLMRPMAPARAELSSLHPVLLILKTLALWVGLPVFVLASTSPLLQRWFGHSAHKKARDPYFLYVASNVGSLVALLGYPVLIEPFASLTLQRQLWFAGYGLLACVVAAVAWCVRGDGASLKLKPKTKLRPPRPAQAAWWVVLAFLPSSALLGATTFISTDLAPIPLLWVVPFALYLLSFIFAMKTSDRKLQLLSRLTAFLSILVYLTLSRAATYPVWLVIALHLSWLMVVALMCHTQLMRSRPGLDELTGFYLCIAVGGVLGGLFNSIIAPLAFRGLAEYPLAILIACALRPPSPLDAARSPRQELWRDVGLGLLIAALTVELGRILLFVPWLPYAVHNLIAVGLPMALCLRFAMRRRRFLIALASLTIAAGVFGDESQTVLLKERNFYGSIRVVRDPRRGVTALYHGSTIHGAQALDPARRREATTYYTAAGPAGDVFTALRRPAAVGVVGLGAGTLATYARAGDDWTFYEINPQVVEVARDARFFTFLSDAAVSPRIELGDARLQLSREEGPRYDLLVLDAFGSDAIPVHLLTREALKLYWSRLRAGGVLAFHVSNNYLDLGVALGALARETGTLAFVRDDRPARSGPDDELASRWVVMAREPASARFFETDSRWRRLAPGTSQAWSDDYFNLVGLMRFFRN